MTVGIGGGLDDALNLDNLYRGQASVREQTSIAAEGQVDAAPSWWTAVVMRPRVEEVAGAAVLCLVRPVDRCVLERGNADAIRLPSADVRSDIEAIICAPGTPWPCEWALATVACESSFRVEAWATEIHNGRRYWFHGWFQIVSTSPNPGPLADPVYNTERAAWKYINEGTGAWPGCP